MKYDPRITPARPDLAASHLKGTVAADRFVDGRMLTVAAPVLDLISTPDRDAGLATQLLMGEQFLALDENHETGLAWGQNQTDGYVGYVSLAGLEADCPDADHWVVANSTHLYPEPNIKTRPLEALSFLCRVKVTGEDGAFYEVSAGGYCPKRHQEPIAPIADDYVAIAERFLGVPYLWGGRSFDGIDCSGLVQLALAATGISAPRDTDMQFLELGQPVENTAQRGDLVFWKGHIGIMQSETILLHANANFMMVTSEPLAVAEARIAQTDGPITGIRRLA